MARDNADQKEGDRPRGRGATKDHLARLKPAGWAPRLYREGDEAGILPLYPLAFQGLERSEAYWDWKFRQNPEGSQIVVAEDGAGRIVGQIAAVPARVHAEGREATFFQVVDLMVDPRLRRGLRKAGMYITMMATLIGEGTGPGRAALLYGFPNQDSDRVTQEVFGWANLHQVTRVVRRLAAEPRAPGRLARSRYAVHPLERFEGVADRLWDRCGPHLPLATIRDARYLTWRYLRCPHVRYDPHMVWDRWRNRPAGLSVLRMGWEGQRLCAIVEWLVPRGESAPASVLLAHAEAEARRAGMAEIAAWFPPDSPEQRWFTAQGYTAEPTRYPLLAGAYAPDLSLDRVARHWYYTMGDTDVF